MDYADRPRLNAIAGPIVGEFLLAYTVAIIGLWLASHSSDGAAGGLGLASQVLDTFYVVYRVLAIGMGVVITQLLGGGQRDGARATALNALAACTWSGLAVAAVLLFGNDLILAVLNAPRALWPMLAPYLRLLAGAALLDAYNLTMAAILRAHLHVRDSLRVMIVMHCTHLALAVPLMLGVAGHAGLGLNGFAVALLSSRALGLVLHLVLWRRRLGLRPTLANWWRGDARLLAPVLRIGVPGAASELAYRIAFMVSLAGAARLGVQALATHSYVLQLLRYVLLISTSIGWACEIMVGRLVGAGRLRAAHALAHKCLRNGMATSGLVALAAALAAPWLMRVFTHDPQVIEGARTLLRIAIVLEIGRVFNLVLPGALRASGDANYPVVAGIGSYALVLGVGSYFLGRAFGLPGIFAVYAADEWTRGVLLLARWQSRGWLLRARAARRGVSQRRCTKVAH